MFGEGGEYLHTIGRPGEGPAEFVDPRSITTTVNPPAIFVGDLRRRLQLFDTTDSPAMPPTYDGLVEVPVQPLALCSMGDKIVIHGLKAVPGGDGDEKGILYSLIHVIDSDGELQGSFGRAYESPNRIMNHQVSNGFLACDESSDAIFFAPRGMLGELHRYGLAGEVAWILQVSSFVSNRYYDLDRGSYVSAPPGGFHRTESLTLLSSEVLLLQFRFLSPETSGKPDYIDSYLVSASDGSAAYLGTSIPLIVAASPEGFVTMAEVPNVVFQIWRYEPAPGGRIQASTGR
jgi:hypothetical protein